MPYSNKKEQPELIDNFGRKLNYLRVSITDKCNLKCSYCVSHTPSPKLTHDEILRYEEVLKIVEIGARHGITKVRITGGEPLVRRGVYEFLNKLTAINGLTDVSLTTNGVFLKDNLKTIKDAGIRRLNISIDSLKKDKFKEITGTDMFETVWESIISAYEEGFNPIKLNVVAIPNVNTDELADFAKLTLKYPFHVRFIEYMPIGTPDLIVKKKLLTPEIKNIISQHGKIYKVDNGLNDGPAQLYRFEEGKGSIGFISPVSQHFCNSCNRMRLTASGKLRSCLLSDKTTDISGPLRRGCSDEELYQIMLNAAAQKGEKHHLELESSSADKVLDQMSSIGG